MKTFNNKQLTKTIADNERKNIDFFRFTFDNKTKLYSKLDVNMAVVNINGKSIMDVTLTGELYNET